jgi:hypothetical protein
MDFFLWGYGKDIVYKTKVRDINDLKERITECRRDVLRATNGAYVEVF